MQKSPSGVLPGHALILTGVFETIIEKNEIKLIFENVLPIFNIDILSSKDFLMKLYLVITSLLPELQILEDVFK